MSKGQGQNEADLQSIFTLTLSSIRVNGSRRETHVEEIVINKVGSLLGLDEDESARKVAWRSVDRTEPAAWHYPRPR